MIALETVAGLPASEVRRAAEARLCRESLSDFIRRGWASLHPGQVLHWGPMQDAVATHVEAWWRGQIPRLLICQPPGTAKSMFASIYGMAWAWTWDPTMRAICLSANPRVALIGANRMHELIASEWYQRTFRPSWQFSRSQDTKSYFENTAGGARWSQSTGSNLIGMRAPRILADDLVDAKEILAGRNLDTVARAWDWYSTVATTRLTLGVPTAECIIAQRLAEGDPPGMALVQGGWDHLCLPAEYDGEGHAPTSLGWVDWRKEKGELLDDRLLTPKVLESARLNLSEIGYQTQYNQVPAPAGGAMIQRHWLRYWGDGEHSALCPGKLIPELARFEEPGAKPWECIVISVDGTWKRTTDSDYAVVQVWGILDRPGARCLRVLLAQFRERCLPQRMAQAVLRLEAEWGGCAGYHHTQTVIEAKASGPNVAEYLRQTLPNVADFEVQGTQKGERLAAVAGEFEDGLVMVPTPAGGAWTWSAAYLAELFAFPNGTHDDQVDATSQALLFSKRFDLGVCVPRSLGAEDRDNVVPLRR
jgi:predicted phage terminase large subunit-like protein